MADTYARYPSLRDRVVFVTGGASGIGEAHVTQFAEQGSKVAFIDIDDRAAEALVERLAAAGHARPWYRNCDLRDVKALQATIAEAAAALGAITVLVNNAANDQRHAWDTVTVEYWEDRLQVNLRHQFFAAQAVIPGMQAAGGGSIINFGSLSWHLGQGGMPAYTASKAAIEGLTRGLARDVGPDRIRVNCVIPGWIMTERQRTLWLNAETNADRMKGQCLKDDVNPVDVARLVLWLAADDSRMCSSQNWICDGGWM